MPYAGWEVGNGSDEEKEELINFKLYWEFVNAEAHVAKTIL